MPVYLSFQNQNRQGFLLFYRLKVLILQVFQGSHVTKRLTERRCRIAGSLKKA